MQSRAMTNILPHHQQLLAKRTSLQDLMLTSYAWPVEQMVDDDYLKRGHPGVELIGMVGFDIDQQKFVLLKMENEEIRIGENTALSAREQEVMQLVALGYSNVQIARELVISKNTVKVHLRHIFDKLKVQSRTEAAMHAVRQGWVTISPMVKPDPAC